MKTSTLVLLCATTIGAIAFNPAKAMAVDFDISVSNRGNTLRVGTGNNIYVPQETRYSHEWLRREERLREERRIAEIRAREIREREIREREIRARECRLREIREARRIAALRASERRNSYQYDRGFSNSDREFRRDRYN